MEKDNKDLNDVLVLSLMLIIIQFLQNGFAIPNNLAGLLGLIAGAFLTAAALILIYKVIKPLLKPLMDSSPAVKQSKK